MLALRDISPKRGLEACRKVHYSTQGGNAISSIQTYPAILQLAINITGDKFLLPLGVLRIRPEEITHGSIVGNFLLSVNCPEIQHVYQEPLKLSLRAFVSSTINLIWSRVWMEGLSPPWTQKILPSMMAERER